MNTPTSHYNTVSFLKNMTIHQIPFPVAWVPGFGPMGLPWSIFVQGLPRWCIPWPPPLLMLMLMGPRPPGGVGGGFWSSTTGIGEGPGFPGLGGRGMAYGTATGMPFSMPIPAPIPPVLDPSWDPNPPPWPNAPPPPNPPPPPPKLPLLRLPPNDALTDKTAVSKVKLSKHSPDRAMMRLYAGLTLRYDFCGHAQPYMRSHVPNRQIQCMQHGYLITLPRILWDMIICTWPLYLGLA